MSDQGKNTTHDTALGWGILACVFLVLFWLFWHYFQYEVKSAFRWWRWGEMKIISLFVDDDYTVVWKSKQYPFNQVMDWAAQLPADSLNGPNLDVISATTMMPLKMIFMGALVLMGLWSLMYGPGTRFRRKLTLDGLIRAQSRTFPVILPFIKFNPSKQPSRPPGAPVPADLPAFAEALGPEEWLAYNQIPVPNGNINEQAAFIAFSQQLGPRWQGPMKLAPHKKVLLAAFCLKASRKRKEADALLGRLAKCWSFENGFKISTDGKLLKDSLNILRNKSLAGLVLSRCNQHGFETTALIRALSTAREEGGVLAPAQFVWLRAHDRALWYPLNNLGRQSFHIEALGAMAHYKAERLTRRPIPKPKVQNAVKTIVSYMKSIRARPIPQLDYKGSKKRGIKKPENARQAQTKAKR